jgi:hypothetical protein
VSGFARQTGYPIIGKPDVGVGASGTYKMEGDEQLQSFYKTESNYGNYVVEELITGEICSYDAIIDARGNPLFEWMTVWGPSIMDIVNLRLDLSYYVDREIPDSLRELGQGGQSRPSVYGTVLCIWSSSVLTARVRDRCL